MDLIITTFIQIVFYYLGILLKFSKTVRINTLNIIFYIIIVRKPLHKIYVARLYATCFFSLETKLEIRFIVQSNT